jgi:membrane protein
VFVPNTRVRFRSAMVGALVAGALWQTLGWMFATFMAGSTHYTAIYSGLAILILFMIWIYIAWLVLLIGASIAFYHQHPEYLAIRTREPSLSIRLRERLALLIGGHIACRHYRGDPPWSSEALSQALGIPNSTTQRILELLEAGQFLAHTADEPPRYLPAHAPEMIRVTDLLNQVRGFEEGAQDRAGALLDPGIAALERRIEDAVAVALEGMTLRDLADSLEAIAPAVSERP